MKKVAAWMPRCSHEYFSGMNNVAAWMPRCSHECLPEMNNVAAWMRRCSHECLRPKQRLVFTVATVATWADDVAAVVACYVDYRGYVGLWDAHLTRCYVCYSGYVRDCD